MVEHEEHAELQMFKEDQAFYFPFGTSHTFIEEVEKNSTAKPTSDGEHASTCLVDESCRGLVHIYSPHNFISATSFGNEDWVKGFFLFVPHEEKEDPTFVIDGCRDIPCDVKSTHVLPQKETEDSLAIRDIDEDMPFE